MSTPEEPIPVTPVKGQRRLSQNDIDMMNCWKDLEGHVANLYAATHTYTGVDRHALNLAADKFRDAFMWANRSIAKPDDVYTIALAEAVANNG